MAEVLLATLSPIVFLLLVEGILRLALGDAHFALDFYVSRPDLGAHGLRADVGGEYWMSDRLCRVTTDARGRRRVMGSRHAFRRRARARRRGLARLRMGSR